MILKLHQNAPNWCLTLKTCNAWMVSFKFNWIIYGLCKIILLLEFDYESSYASHNGILETVDSHNIILETVYSHNSILETVDSHDSVLETVDSHNIILETVDSHNSILETVDSHNSILETILWSKMWKLISQLFIYSKSLC